MSDEEDDKVVPLFPKEVTVLDPPEEEGAEVIQLSDHNDDIQISPDELWERAKKAGMKDVIIIGLGGDSEEDTEGYITNIPSVAVLIYLLEVVKLSILKN